MVRSLDRGRQFMTFYFLSLDAKAVQPRFWPFLAWLGLGLGLRLGVGLGWDCARTLIPPGRRKCFLVPTREQPMIPPQKSARSDRKGEALQGCTARSSGIVFMVVAVVAAVVAVSIV